MHQVSQSLFNKSHSIMDMVEKSIDEELNGIKKGNGFKSGGLNPGHQNMTDPEMKEVARLKKLELSLHKMNLHKMQRLATITQHVKMWTNVDI